MSDGDDRLALVWRGLDAWRAEFAHVLLREDGFGASGTQIGVEPEPYRVEYSLEVSGGWLTERQECNAYGSGWWRGLELVRERDGTWRCEVGAAGDLDGDRPGGDMDGLEGALDCDLQHSPLTNVMPVRRDELTGPAAGPREYAMAWVAIPWLSVHRSEQRYEPIGAQSVRYVSLDSDFTADLELDGHGFAERYPQLGERVPAA